ncbi:LysM peptidoglycan-binding domain-containing protein [Brucepastera parasyntrophica]|uniref:RHS repeat-associated core domain-containing protein n=1 Tax=Brucepastera parasyntrophica TaxID=2880008 RepID=UPI00210D72A6|nr:RHS repeat-associated core domain-containing protein [Brucepastera parasyntrophica]ULQ59049.1 LysM peptidoglycan-binding domain-containing protein [Brucepastera parasyntrophica]
MYTYGGPEAASENRADRVIRIEDESGSIEYEYGSLGEVTVETRTLGRRSHDRTGTVKTAEMRYRSDYLGRMEEITYPDGEVVKYAYNYGGAVERVTGEKQGETFVYVDKIGYDEWGQRVYIRLGNGVETSYTYDENRRWLSGIETRNAGTVLQNMEYRFDRVGNVSGYENNAGAYMTKQDYTYDSLYQLTGVTGESRASETGEYQAAYSQSYRFDEGGLGKMMEKVSASSQSDGRILGDDLNYSLDYEYEAGYVHRVSRIGGRYYQYDASGNLTVEQDGPFTKGEPVNRNYTVTGLGNEVYVTDHGWGMSEDPSTGSGGTGGTQSPWKREYTWNERNQLKRSRDSRYTVVYTYGADGQRSGKYSVGGSGSTESETLYFNKLWTWRYDGQVSNAAGQNSKHIYVGESRLVTKIGRADGSFTNEERVKQYWYHSDHLGSAQLITNADGEEYERIEYTPYGELWIEKASTASNIDIPYRFTGKEKDEETGLYYYGARYLDPKTSRWLSTDPALGAYIPGAGGNNSQLPGMGGVYNTVNLHLYHYAGNNPVRYTDPTGRNTERITVKEGDSMSELLAAHNDKYNTNYTVDEVAAYNEIKNADLIFPNQDLKLPPRINSNDTGANDTGANDTGTNDTGTNDTGTNDTGTNAKHTYIPIQSIKAAVALGLGHEFGICIDTNGNIGIYRDLLIGCGVHIPSFIVGDFIKVLSGVSNTGEILYALYTMNNSLDTDSWSEGSLKTGVSVSTGGTAEAHFFGSVSVNVSTDPGNAQFGFSGDIGGGVYFRVRMQFVISGQSLPFWPRGGE